MTRLSEVSAFGAFGVDDNKVIGGDVGRANITVENLAKSMNIKYLSKVKKFCKSELIGITYFPKLQSY